MHIEKNVTESFMGTLLMNDKSKDTPKARKDLEKLGIRKELWLADNGKGKLLKPHPQYSFTNEDRHRFCQFIKGVKLPDGFGSNFRPKVTDNDNITGMKSHDYHIMMQRLLPVGVRAKAEGSIAEGYVADEALTFCSMYLEDIETRFNRPDRNGDTPISDIPVTSHEISVFESVCSLIGKRTTITFNDEEYKKVEWYVLNNSPEIRVEHNVRVFIRTTFSLS
ncbi:hypothetical protein Tco_0496967 [Tanacetum coccineum]